jgi:Flp pilus assembly protein TadB
MFLKTQMRLCSTYANRAVLIFALVEVCILAAWWLLKWHWLGFGAGAVAVLFALYLSRLESYFRTLKATAAAQDEFQEYVDRIFEESERTG